MIDTKRDLLARLNKTSPPPQFRPPPLSLAAKAVTFLVQA